MNKNKGYINKLLYEARIKRQLSTKQVSSSLKISRVYLYLIEHGYLNVKKSKQNDFIKFYKLDKNFFSSNYALPVEIEEKKKKSKKKNTALLNKLSKLYLKIITATILGVSIGTFVYGTFAMNRQNDAPRTPWTTTFTTFVENTRKYGTKSFSLLNDGAKFVIEGKQISHELTSENLHVESYATLNVYELDKYASDTNIVLTEAVYNNTTHECLFTFYFDIYVYNRKKIVYSTLLSTSETVPISINSALCFFDEDYNLELRPFTYTTKSGEIKKAQIGDEIYNEYKNQFNKYIIYTYDAFNDGILKDQLSQGHDLAYTDIRPLVDDLQTISRFCVFNFRLGNISRIVSSCFIALSTGLLGLSIFASVYLKKKNKPEKETVFNTNNVIGVVPKRNSITKDIKYSGILPEFSLKLIGIAIIALSSIAIYITAYALLKDGFYGFKDVNKGRKLINMFLIAGSSLLFFVKLDVYSKKSIKDLLTNIVILFLFGFVYYEIEITLYRSISGQNAVFEILLNILVTVIPGNIAWNLMLYSLIFLFLFTYPKNIKDNKNKLLAYRLCSLLPTLFLIFSLIYKSVIEKNILAPYWLSFMFYTKGLLMTIFVVFYLYGLYFYRKFATNKYGQEECENVYFNSRKYNLNKNIMASIIILIVFLVDLTFKYVMPDNIFHLGNNWAIILLIPIILLYRPHIGKRNKHLDTGYIVLLAVAYTIGYIMTISLVLSLLDLSDLLAILF